ncbi:MAG: hypothetical protein KBB83_01630 [Alphaproteobacteria bacterium]|nr:hypothetical protein [Alphaproteobacteria bacterium]
MMLDKTYRKFPIVVDLDGTLIFDEISCKAFKRLIVTRPFKLLLAPLWLMKGVAYFKKRVANLVYIDPARLNYNPKVLQFIKSHQGQEIILATGADQKYAHVVARFLKLFHHVIASDGRVNCVSHHKAERLIRKYGKSRYIYLGNSSQDLAVWKDSLFAVAVNAPKGVLKDLAKLNVPYKIL